MSRNRYSYTAAFVGITAGVIVAMIWVSQATLYFQDAQIAGRIADQALGRSEAIARARKLSIRRIEAIKQVYCTDEDISELKGVAFHSSYLSDVGRVKDGRLICSALWGRMDPLLLPPNRYASGEVRLWNASDLDGSPYAGANLVVKGDAYVVTSPTTFGGLESTPLSHITIKSRDRSWLYREITPEGDISLASAPVVRVERCSKSTNACVSVESPRRMFWKLSKTIVLTTLLAGLFLGLLVSHLLIRHRNTTRRSIQKRLSLALRRGEIELEYQPLRRISSGYLVGFEALARWRPGGEEEIPPAVFVPAANQLGLSSSLFRYVLACALRDLADELQQRKDIYVSVNAEPADMTENGIVRYIESLSLRSGILPSQLRIEITERDILACPNAIANMESLATMGYKFLIDDFGTGSSNFSHLARSPFKGIKIDRLFTAAITEDSPLRPVIYGMCQIADELGLEVIAEGVETIQQQEALRIISKTVIGQGWLYGRPVRGSVALSLMKEEEGAREHSG